MSERSAAFVFFTGLIVTCFGAGGVENSIATADLVTSVIVAAVGLMTMYCGTRGLRQG